MPYQREVPEFRQLVSLKYQLYNSLFLTLPFSGLKKTGIKLPVFAQMCDEGLEKGESPETIVSRFCREILHSEKFDEITEVLFLFLQLIERQVVLFDALEDAAFNQTHDPHTAGGLTPFLHTLGELGDSKAAHEVSKFSARLVLTAHPTQFYPESILNIITDLAEALQNDDLQRIERLLLQMGKTSFRNSTPPTPLSEAQNLIHRYTTIFYDVLSSIQMEVEEALEPLGETPKDAVVQLGFWPGGDRDGNPHVTVETTRQTAAELKQAVLTRYSKQMSQLKRRLTFKGIKEPLCAIQNKLNKTLANEEGAYSHADTFIQDLQKLRSLLVKEHQSLFVDMLDALIVAVRLFGFHFASLDLRQDSRVHADTVASILYDQDIDYLTLDSKEKKKVLLQQLSKPRPDALNLETNLHKDVIHSLHVAQEIQASNGTQGLHRYIISNCRGSHNVLEVLLLAYWAGWPLEELQLDIVPLFETIKDLQSATKAMEELFSTEIYRGHLKRRDRQQVVMLGFSDGTKDGGYTSCNWSIFRCKESLYNLGKVQNVQMVFFDGRGGPPARGGGNTHRFYRAMSYQFPQSGVQLTIQGQTISSKFGTPVSARFNFEQIYTAGMEHLLFPLKDEKLHRDHEEIMDQLSSISLQAYQELRQHPAFVPFLEKMTTLGFYSDLNIASRPTKRGKSEGLNLEDLRAIPFVGAWSQLKINIPGFYGLGTALHTLIEKGWLKVLQQFYTSNLFFRTLLDNAQMALSKSYLPLTQYMRTDEQFGSFWEIMQNEALRTKEAICQVAQQKQLLERDPLIQSSIQLRERMILPLLVIQQYAMIQLRKNPEGTHAPIFRKLILKTIPPNINASRNSA